MFTKRLDLRKPVTGGHRRTPFAYLGVKSHRHDQEVWAFAKELSDNVIGGLDGGDLSSSGSGSKSRRLSFKGMGTKVATQMLGPDGQ